MKIVISGLPFSGKSTVFKALVGKAVQPRTSASGKVQLSIGTLEVKDVRLERLARILNSEKVTYPQISLVDLTFLGEASCKGMQTAYLKEYDVLALVIGVFSSRDPVAELADVEAELVLADIQILQNRIERINKERKAHPGREESQELLLLKRCVQALEEEVQIRYLKLGPGELKMLAGFQLLTLKPVIIIANISEEQLQKGGDAGIKKEVQAKHLELFSFCAKLEAEIEELPEEERPEFLKEMGLTALSKDRFIQVCLQALQLISFFTVVGKEARAWLVRRGITAVEAAGCVHSDMERGFIRAEVINYRDFIDCGTFIQAREKGLLRLESREYAVQDGDIINFKFSV